MSADRTASSAFARYARCSALLLCLAALTACKPPAAAPPATAPAAPATSTAMPGDAEPAADTDSTDDLRTLAGRFSDGESTLELAADGRYVQVLQAAGTAISATGSWKPAGAGAITLSPDGNPAADVRFDAISADELRAQDGSRTFRRIAGD